MCYNTGNEEKQKVHGTFVWHIAMSSQEMTAARHLCGYGTQEIKKPKGVRAFLNSREYRGSDDDSFTLNSPRRSPET